MIYKSHYSIYIYKITNIIDNKIYVGQHIHKKDKKDTYMGSGSKLKKIIKLLGKDNFTKEILEECDYDELNEKEIFWIEKLDATNPNIGYNVTAGGENCVPTEEFKRIIKDARNKKDEISKKEWYAKISKTLKDKEISKGINNPMFGKEYTESRRQKCAETKKKNKDKHLYYSKDYRDFMSIKNAGENNPNYNNKWSDDKKNKLSLYLKQNEIHKGEKNSSYGKIGKNGFGYKSIDNNIKDKIIYDYKNNFLNITDLIEKYNISRRKIKEILKEQNIIIKRIYFSEENLNLLKNMAENKLSISAIAEHFKMDHRTIKKILKKHQDD